MRHAASSREEALSEARRTGILTVPSTTYGAEWAEVWRETCKAERRPLILITKRRTYAVVEVDMTPAGHLLSPTARSVMGTIARRFWSAHGRFRIDNQGSTVGGVEPRSAWTLAVQLQCIVLEDIIIQS